jgi:hypothetical protein
LNLETRMVTIWMDHGGSVPQNKCHSPGGAKTSAPRAQRDGSYDLVLWLVEEPGMLR